MRLLLIIISITIRINPLLMVEVSQETPPYQPTVEREGLILWYGEGVMDSVVNNLCSNPERYPHAAGLDCEAAYTASCRIASPHYKVGTWVYVNGIQCLVTDTSAPQDKARHLERGIIAEAAYENSATLCGKPKTNCYGWIGR